MVSFKYILELQQNDFCIAAQKKRVKNNMVLIIVWIHQTRYLHAVYYHLNVYKYVYNTMLKNKPIFLTRVTLAGIGFLANFIFLINFKTYFFSLILTLTFFNFKERSFAWLSTKFASNWG